MKSNMAHLDSKIIHDKIFTIRGVQVMLDRDLAKLYHTETRTLKQAVKRNLERFPSDFMFKLTDSDIEKMVSQSVIPSKSYFGGSAPFAFTEQGVSMLSAVIRTPIAVDISLKIIRVFVTMRKFITQNRDVFKRLSNLEKKHFKIDEKFEKVFKAIESKNAIPEKGIFFEGQVFDAYAFISKLIKKAKKSIILIDNYIDETVLVLLLKRRKTCKVTIYTKAVSRQLQLDLKKYNEQYTPIEIKTCNSSHDRFLILDNKTVYHFGASLKDLGKKMFAFSKFGEEAINILQRVKK